MTQGAIWVGLSRVRSGDGADRATERKPHYPLSTRARPTLRWARRLTQVWAMSLAVSGLLIGCGNGEAQPSPTFGSPSPQPAASVTPSPTDTPIAPPTRPPAMDNPDDAGAVAAATYFMELQSYSLRSGDLSEWNAVSGDTCEFCANTSAMVERVYGLGHRIEGQTIAIDMPRVLALEEALSLYSVELHYALEAGTQVDGFGAEVQALPAGEGYIVLDLVPSYRGWVLVGGDAQDGPAL